MERKDFPRSYVGRGPSRGKWEDRFHAFYTFSSFWALFVESLPYCGTSWHISHQGRYRLLRPSRVTFPSKRVKF